jgi:hypothetical protein
MTASHADLLSVGEERVLVGRQGPSAISSGVDPRERLLDRRSQAKPGGAEHSLQPAVVPAASAVLRRRAPEAEGSKAASRLDRDRTASLADEGGASAVRFEARGVAPDEAAAEEDRMRLLAALLALGALLIWIVFLAG